MQDMALVPFLYQIHKRTLLKSILQFETTYYQRFVTKNVPKYLSIAEGNIHNFKISFIIWLIRD